jgi:hypothetical protein
VTHYDVKIAIEFAAARAALEQLSKLDEWVPRNDEKTLYDFLCSCLNQFFGCTHGSLPDPSSTPYRPYVSLIDMELGIQPEVPGEAKTATIFRPSSKKKPDGRSQVEHPDHATPSKLLSMRHNA